MKRRRQRLTDMGTAGLVALALAAGFAGGALLDEGVLSVPGESIQPPPGAVDEFELVTRHAGHAWHRFDLTDTFAAWMGQEEYAEEFFQQPELLDDLLPDEYMEFLVSLFEQFCADVSPDENGVVALTGVGSLFGFLKVKDMVDTLAPKVPGRLLVFFPGSYENNNYRLLDGYDGWNYLAVPITADKEF